MSIFGGIVTFIVVWWIVLFMVLPWGVRSQLEASNPDEIVLGSEIGAPKKANLKVKFLTTTLIAFAIWAFFFIIFYRDIVSIKYFLQ
jgi:predicted secreted protein